MEEIVESFSAVGLGSRSLEIVRSKLQSDVTIYGLAD